MPKTKPEEDAKLLFLKGKKAFDTGQTEDAFSNLNQAYLFYKQTNENAIVAEILRMLGELYFNKGMQIESRNYYKHAFTAFKNFNNKIGMADCYDKITLSFMMQDELTHANEYQEKALEIRKNTPDKKGLVRGMKNLAIIKYRLTEDGTIAIKILEEAYELAKRSKDPQLIINILLDKSKMHSKTNDFESAMECIVIARRYGKKFSIKLPEESEEEFANILLNLGLNYYDKGDTSSALKYLKNASLILKSKNKSITESVESIISKLESN
ncbi:MAG: tetratricopeptide repeat protein [Candidatus Thorarchaeota archaeon]